jgi:hypothetical protein
MNRLGVLKGQIAVSATRYIEKLVAKNKKKEGIQQAEKIKREKLKASVFREHVINIEQMIGPALDRYADDLFKYLVHQLQTSGQLTEEGDSIQSGIPLSESAQRTWLRKALRDWQANFPK